ncbi:MAG TPA: c-type cytochrome [Rubellimicrobium sp.]|jgi:cytochrome c|nr:c-type cytochrome [Rubellimicrobium sp.]
MRVTLLATLAVLGPVTALAQEAMVGDAAAGEEHFNRQCIACHVVQNEAGEVLAGRNAKVGPNLYGVAGRTPGTYPEFDYSELMVAYGATGVVWEESNFVPYVQDPTGFLREATGEDGRSKMAYQVRDEQEAYDLWAFLSTFAPADAAGGDAAAAEGDAAAAAPAEGEAASQ